MKKVHVTAFLGALVLALGACGDDAEDDSSAAAGWPEREIEFIIPTTAGGQLDTIARNVASSLEEKLGVTIVPINAEGAGQTLGTRQVKDALPDGYTVAMSGTTPAVIGGLTSTSGYTLDDFASVGGVSHQGFIVMMGSDNKLGITEPSTEAASEFLDHLKADPGDLKSAATGGIGQTTVWSKAVADKGYEWTVVPFAGGSEATAALLGGNIDLYIASVSENFLSMIDAGEIVPVISLTQERLPQLPDVPALGEFSESQGTDFSDINAYSYFDVKVRADVDEEIRNQLQAALEETMSEPEIQEAIGDGFVPEEFLDGEAMMETFRLQSELFAPYVEELEAEQ